MPGISCYALRDSNHVVCCRHGTHDVEVVHEVFVRGAYRIPARIRQRLLALDRPLNVVGLGANVGTFSVYVQTVLPVARLVSVEADPENFDVLRACAAANATRAEWRVLHAAARTSTGSVAFLGGRFASSRVASEPDASGSIRVPSVDAFPLLAAADLVKIDVEGSEWNLLADGRLSALAATAIVLEYHEVFCGDAAPERAAARLLADAGFAAGAPFNRFPTRGMIWGWRLA